MLISTRSRYALRVLARMAGKGTGRPMSLAVLSEEELVSVRYLEQIFGKLRTTGLVRGKRGPGGGYVLSRPPEDISLFDVVNALETEFLPVNCLSEDRECNSVQKGSVPECPLEKSCVTRPLWLRLRSMYYDFMKRHSLADLVAGRVSEEGEQG